VGATYNSGKVLKEVNVFIYIYIEWNWEHRWDWSGG